MGDIEDPDCVSHREMLARDARVPKGHFEACELHEFGLLLMKIKKRSPPQLRFRSKDSLFKSRIRRFRLISLWQIKTPRMDSEFDLVSLIDKLAGANLKDGDILVISSKFVGISEGRIVRLKTVNVSRSAKDLSAKYAISPELCELIIRESDEIIGGVPGFLLALKNGLFTPNAGIDKSNIAHGSVVLYPRRPLESAILIRGGLKFSRGVNVGVVICDSRLMPTRRGTTGVALAAAGLEGIRDLRGKCDLFGNVLRVTSQAIADDLSSAAQLAMGESDEASPIVIVRGLGNQVVKEANYESRDFAIPTEQCVYMRSLGYRTKKKNRLAS